MSNSRKGICCLVGAGETADEYFVCENADCYIAVDGGYTYLSQREIQPEYTVGDFDSLGEIPNTSNIIRHPVEKDDTDMMLALKMGIQLGYQEFHIYGGTGGRTDHTIANFQILLYLIKEGKQGYLFGRDYVATAVQNRELTFLKDYCGTVSVFAATEKVTGVYLSNLKYPLHEATLIQTVPLGVSNEFLGCEAKIQIGDGVAWIIWNGNYGLALPDVAICK